MSTAPRARTALVVGGGIAGPIAAMALRRAGLDAEVYEAHDSRSDGVGAGMSIAPNGVAALDAIGAGDVVRSVGTPVRSIVVHSGNGRRLAEFATGGEPSRFVWRAELYASLYEEAARRGVRVHHGKRLTGARESADSVTAHFADGSHASADLLIGADGIRSTVRTLIDPTAPGPTYAGLVGIGARVRDTGLPSSGGSMHMTYGRHVFFGYQVFDDSSGVWFVNVPSAEPVPAGRAAELGAERWLSDLGALVAGDRTPARELLARTEPADLAFTGPVEAMLTVPHWSRGRMVLIGDAAHAASPSSGQGASLAAESAVQLARCLRDLPYGQAFAAYEELRRPRVERIIAETARINNDKAAGPVARVLRDLLMPPLMKLLNPAKRAAWQYSHRINWDEPAAWPAR
ncbi:FAD-dependent oxidoreductase [Streptomyces sp. NPDC048416]|uniref:FAD-dependent oxidoreductase n=1 Tax=Streptomyces sp. NPDC048416 TaxID=3365546 RepID=UPI00371CEFCE